jgi:hypothetical protein
MKETIKTLERLKKWYDTLQSKEEFNALSQAIKDRQAEELPEPFPPECINYGEDNYESGCNHTIDQITPIIAKKNMKINELERALEEAGEEVSEEKVREILIHWITSQSDEDNPDKRVELYNQAINEILDLTKPLIAKYKLKIKELEETIHDSIYHYSESDVVMKLQQENKKLKDEIEELKEIEDRYHTRKRIHLDTIARLKQENKEFNEEIKALRETQFLE